MVVGSGESAVLTGTGAAEGVQIVTPPNAFPGGATLSVEPVTATTEMGPAAYRGTPFSVASPVEPAAPVTVAVPADAGSAEHEAIAWWSDDAHAWQPVATAYDPQLGALVATVEHFSIWSKIDDVLLETVAGVHGSPPECDGSPPQWVQNVGWTATDNLGLALSCAGSEGDELQVRVKPHHGEWMYVDFDHAPDSVRYESELGIRVATPSQIVFHHGSSWRVYDPPGLTVDANFAEPAANASHPVADMITGEAGRDGYSYLLDAVSYALSQLTDKAAEILPGVITCLPDVVDPATFDLLPSIDYDSLLSCLTDSIKEAIRDTVSDFPDDQSRLESALSFVEHVSTWIRVAEVAREVGAGALDRNQHPSILVASAETTPSLTSFSPAEGGPGTSITLAGYGLTGINTASIAGTPMSAVHLISDTQVTAVVGTGTGTGLITVSGPRGSSTSGAAFLVTTIPLSTYAGHVVQFDGDNKDQKTAWYVTSDLRRHWIPTAATYNCLRSHGAPTPDVLPSAILEELPDTPGGWATCDGPSFEGSIVRRFDGTSWVIVGAARHLVPDYPTDFCSRYVDGRQVSYTDLTAAEIESIPNGSAYTCSMEHLILRASDKPDPKPSYAFYGSNRHWITDPWTFSSLQHRGFRVVDIATEAAIETLSDGGTEPASLDPVDIPPNSIVRRADGVSWVVGPDHIRHHIPYSQDDVCWRDLRGYPVSALGLTYDEANDVGPEADTWPCIIGSRVVRSDDGSSWFVDLTNTRHLIRDTDTYWFLARRQPVSGPWAAADVAQIPRGLDQPYAIDPGDVANSIICRSDGVCWAVDGGGTRHHIPTYADNVCWRWQNGWHVSRSGLNDEQAGSLSEGAEWRCTMDNTIIATNEGAAYYMQGNTRRWIQDSESFYCYTDNNGATAIRGMGMSEAAGIPEGSWMPQCLSRARVAGHVVRAFDGTAYYVDGSGWWHWIPNGTIWNCITSRHSVYISNANWTQIDSIRRENGWATCSM